MKEDSFRKDDFSICSHLRSSIIIMISFEESGNMNLGEQSVILRMRDEKNDLSSSLRESNETAIHPGGHSERILSFSN